MNRFRLGLFLCVTGMVVAVLSVVLWVREPGSCEVTNPARRGNQLADDLLGPARNAGAYPLGNDGVLFQIVGGASQSEAVTLKEGLPGCAVRINTARYTLAELNQFFDRVSGALTPEMSDAVLSLDEPNNRLLVKSPRRLSDAQRRALLGNLPRDAIAFEVADDFGPRQLTQRREAG